MRITNRIIIWFFERYAFDDWVSSQEKKTRKEMMIKYDAKSEKELDEILTELQQAPLRDAYWAGKQAGVEQLLNSREY